MSLTIVMSWERTLASSEPGSTRVIDSCFTSETAAVEKLTVKMRFCPSA